MTNVRLAELHAEFERAVRSSLEERMLQAGISDKVRIRTRESILCSLLEFPNALRATSVTFVSDTKDTEASVHILASVTVLYAEHDLGGSVRVGMHTITYERDPERSEFTDVEDIPDLVRAELSGAWNMEEAIGLSAARLAVQLTKLVLLNEAWRS